MIKFEFGHIVLLRFPFTDSQSVKKRPALVIKEFTDGDVLVCRITSQLHDSDFDIQVSGKFSNDDISPRKNTLR